MTDVTGEEFKVFVDILSKLKVLSDEHQQLVDLITEQAELDSELQVFNMIIVLRVYCSSLSCTSYYLSVWIG